MKKIALAAAIALATATAATAGGYSEPAITTVAVVEEASSSSLGSVGSISTGTLVAVALGLVVLAVVAGTDDDEK